MDILQTLWVIVILNGTLLVLLILAVLALFVSFNRKIMTDGNPWPTGLDTLPEQEEIGQLAQQVVIYIIL